MRSTSVITSVLAIAAAAGLAILVAAEHRARLKLGADHEDLERQMNQMAGLIATNRQLSNLVAVRVNAAPSPPDDRSRELLRLRGEVGVLRQQTKELETVRNENRQARAAARGERTTRSAGAANADATADYWPRDSWAFAGYANPDAALQTSLWAADNGDAKTLAASTTGEVQQLLATEFEGKSETEASIRAMDHVIGLKSVRILNREVQSPDTIVLTAAFEGRPDMQTGKLVLKKIGDEWKLAAITP